MATRPAAPPSARRNGEQETPTGMRRPSRRVRLNSVSGLASGAPGLATNSARGVHPAKGVSCQERSRRSANAYPVMRSAASLKETTRPARSRVMRPLLILATMARCSVWRFRRSRPRRSSSCPAWRSRSARWLLKMATARKATVWTQDLVHGVAHGPERREPAGELHRTDDPGPLCQDQPGVQKAAHDADREPRASFQHVGGRKDHQDVHERKHGVEAAGEVDQQADQGEVEGALDEALQGQPPLAAEGHGVRQRQAEGHAQKPVEGGGVERETLPQVQDDGGPQERRGEEEACADQPLQLVEQARRARETRDPVRAVSNTAAPRKENGGRARRPPASIRRLDGLTSRRPSPA